MGRSCDGHAHVEYITSICNIVHQAAMSASLFMAHRGARLAFARSPASAVVRTAWVPACGPRHFSSWMRGTEECAWWAGGVSRKGCGLAPVRSWSGAPCNSFRELRSSCVAGGSRSQSGRLVASRRAMSSDMVAAINEKNKSTPVVVYSKTYCPCKEEVHWVEA